MSGGSWGGVQDLSHYTTEGSVEQAEADTGYFDEQFAEFEGREGTFEDRVREARERTGYREDEDEDE